MYTGINGMKFSYTAGNCSEPLVLQKYLYTIIKWSSKERVENLRGGGVTLLPKQNNIRSTERI